MDVVIVAGCRTPFQRSGTGLASLSAIDLGIHAVRELIARSGVDPAEIDELVMGTVLHDNDAPNAAREIGLATLPPTVPAWTVSRACASANQAIADAVLRIRSGSARVIVAGGTESLSRIPVRVSHPLANALQRASKARRIADRVQAFRGIRPKDLLPVAPRIAEPTTGETMGEAAERMARENGIPREAQDRWALRSHQRAAAGWGDGRLAAEVAPLYPPPRFDPQLEDNGIRRDSSEAALARLGPVFDRRFGTITAGNASPLTDGAAAVLLMSAEVAQAQGLRPLARIRSFRFTALDPGGQLLQGPAYAVPGALDDAGIGMEEIGLLEMHEAFAAQVLSNLQALDSDAFARDRLGRSRSVGIPAEERINVMGGSIAIGHPFGATGARITTTLAHEMARRDAQFGLMTVCAAGGMGFAMVLERP